MRPASILLLFIVVIVAASILTSCAAQDRVIHRYNVMAYDDCVYYGFTPGTDPFAKCMQERGAQRPSAGFR